MSALPAVTDATFKAEVLQSAKPVLVDYWADWCTPCKALGPVMAAFAEEYGDRVKFVALDANTNMDVPMAYNVTNLPTVQVFSKGELVGVIAGNVTKLKLRQLLDDVA
jgi:thioredoxin 1